MNIILSYVLMMLPPILYAIGGLVDAHNKKEAINWLIFTKTILIGAVGCGIITQATMDLVLSPTAVMLWTYVFDKLFNALAKKQ